MIAPQEETAVSIPTELIMANAVHEIRTPVQTIIGTLDLLSETHLDSEQTEYVRQIRFGSDVLLTLVNNILDYSKLKSNKVSIESVSFNIKTLVEKTVRIISLEAFRKNIEVETDIDYSLPDLVKGDPTRIQQVLINLLKNSLKFTERGYIYTELSASKDGKFLLFKVTDSGIGIEKEKRQHLFQTYFQGDASISRKYGGSGLGLAICRTLVTAMNGTISFEPNKYGGSIFSFTVPLVPEAENSVPYCMLPVPSSTKILIADASVMASKSLGNKLKSLGLEHISFSSDPEETLMKMKYATRMKNPYNIAFIDMHLPVIDGWHLASEIKNDPQISGTKLYLLVPEGQMGSQAKMKTLNWFSGYLYKPVYRDKLDEMLLQTNEIQPEYKNEETKNREDARIRKEEQQKERTFAAGMKILAADDHSVNRKILVDFLKRFGATVYEAENGEHVLKIIRNNPDIQIVFMDIQMPVLSGIEAASYLRKNIYNGIIIACTANNSKDDFIKYQKAGMNDILHKPFKKESVKTILDKWKTVLMFPTDTQAAFLDSNHLVNDKLWDAEDFEDTIGRDWDLGRQILLDFIDQTTALIKDAKKYIETENFEQLDLIAHTLKGSSAAISANKLFKIGENLNKSVKAQNLDEIKIDLDYFEKLFEIFILSTGKWRHLK